jgi:sigma54-dependent transcription regulator
MLSQVINKPLISVVSHGEIWVLAERNAWGEKKRQALSEMLSDLVTLDLNDRLIIEGYVEVDKKGSVQESDKGGDFGGVRLLA